MSFSAPSPKTLIHYFKVFKAYTGYKLFISVWLSLAVSVVEGFGIALFYPLLAENKMVGQSDSRFFTVLYDIFDALHIPLSFNVVLIVILVVFILKGLLKFVQETYNAYLSTIVARDFRKRIITSFELMDYRYYLKTNTGLLTNIVTVEANAATSTFKFYCQILSSIGYIAAFFILSLAVNWMITLIAMSFGGGALLILNYFSDLSRKYSYSGTRENGRLQSLLIQSIQFYKYLTATATYGILKEKILEPVNTLANLGFKIALINGFVRSIAEPLVLAFVVGIVYFQVSVLGNSFSSIIISIILFQRMMNMMMNFQGVWQSFCSTQGAIDMVTKTIEEIEAGSRDANEGMDLSFEKQIEFKDVSFSYNSKALFSGLNIRIAKNAAVAFIGESGAGKSTLVDLLTGMLCPDQGQICVDGVNLNEVSLQGFRQKIGYVTQESVVFNDTVANNISLWKSPTDGADKDAWKGRVEAAAGDSFSKEFIHAMPEGYASSIGDRGVSLSGGQRQRLAIARELYKNPEILILDEATSALDTESERYIQKSIELLKGRTTLVIIAHRLSTIKNCDYIYILKQGRIVEQGKPDDLLAYEHSEFKRMCSLQQISAKGVQ